MNSKEARDVDQQRRPDQLRWAFELVDAFGSFHEDDIRARLLVEVSALNRAIEAFDRARIGARHDQGFRTTAGIHRSLNFPCHLNGRNDLWAKTVACDQAVEQPMIRPASSILRAGPHASQPIRHLQGLAGVLKVEPYAGHKALRRGMP